MTRLSKGKIGAWIVLLTMVGILWGIWRLAGRLAAALGGHTHHDQMVAFVVLLGLIIVGIASLGMRE